MKFLILSTLVIVVGCASGPTLEQLEEEANTSGDWTTVEKREELMRERREITAPGCPVGQRKKCYKELSGIECYCITLSKRY